MRRETQSDQKLLQDLLPKLLQIGGNQPVPRYSPAGGQPTVYSGFPDGGQCQRRPQQLCVAGTADNAGTLSSAVLRTPVEEGRLQVNPSGRAHPSHDVIRKLQLLNSTSICYINAFVLAYLWACGSLDATDHQCYGACTQAWRHVLYARKPISIISLLSWRFLLRGWASLNQQHDVAEFAYFALCRFQPSVCFGTWQARQSRSGECTVTDAGDLFAALPLHLTAETTIHQLQDLVDGWHRQAAVHALLHPPTLLFLQILRYGSRNGVPFRRQDLVSIPEVISVPVFRGEGLECGAVLYTFRSAVLHHGVSPFEGHYTAQLSARGILLATDDSRPARRVSSLGSQWEYNVYCLLFTRQVVADAPSAIGERMAENDHGVAAQSHRHTV